ncbi:hypothetical protein IFM89_032077 [Coptis chinensis]|uniref:Uncharacterized protein n=1 Tax=Coptis chinensis TaxID=261450 RepID=A0A835LX05_9MAGN|nr:hypothetical protein IFM89_032077 [Coptis chinensis]
MRQTLMIQLVIGALACLSVLVVEAEDPYRYFTWTVTYGPISPLGVPQQVCFVLIKFGSYELLPLEKGIGFVFDACDVFAGYPYKWTISGPRIDCVTNDNIIVTVINKLDQPFLITWSGINQRKNSWQDGVLGTNCPIPPQSSHQYRFQAKDQIGTFTYFLSTLMQRASGGFGGFNVYSRPMIPVPFAPPAGDFTLLVGDWYKSSHKALQQTLDSGKALPFPDGILINGSPKSTSFVGERGKTYMFRVSNVGLSTSFNFRIQGHTLKLVEMEGSHTVQQVYESLDVHVGQSVAVLVTLNQAPKDYYIVASTRFTKPIITATGILHYSNSHTPASGPLPIGPTYQVHWSMKQARTFRWNLTASAARPNPQGSFHYGAIKPARTIVLANSASRINGKLRYAVNRVSYVNPDTPLKLADYFNIPGVFNLNTILDKPTPGSAFFGTSVIGTALHDYVEIIFQNNENTIQSWHLDGQVFWVVGYGNNQWTAALRNRYNLYDATTRHTVQVYPNSWSAIYVSLDNKGMWNLRSSMWARQYLGQQLYFRVWSNERSLYTEYDIPRNAILCGKAQGRHT